MRTIFLCTVLMSGLAFAQSVTTKGAAGKPVSVEVVPIDQEPAHKLVFENEYVRVFSVEVAPRSETKYHQHDRDIVGVILGDAEVESVRVGGAPVKSQLKHGETRFTKGGFAHKVVNKGDKPFRNVTVELKKGLSGFVPSAAGAIIVDGHSSRKTVLLSDRVTCTQIQGMMGAFRSWDPLAPSKHYLVVAAGRGFITRKGKEKVLSPGEFEWLGPGTSSDAGAIRDGGGLMVCGFKGEAQGPSRQKQGSR